MRKTFQVLFAVLILFFVGIGVSFYYWNLSYLDGGGIDYFVLFGGTRATLDGVSSDEFSAFGDKTVYINRDLGFQVAHLKDWDIIDESHDEITIASNDVVAGREFVIEVTDLDLDSWVEEFDSEGSSRVFERDAVSFAGKSATKMKASTAIGLDLSIIYVKKGSRAFVLKYHAFNEAHQVMIEGFKFIEE